MSDNSPNRKKMRLSSNELKRSHQISDRRDVSGKKLKIEDERKKQKKENFMIACKVVSCNAHNDVEKRFMLVDVPLCAQHQWCHHCNDKVSESICKLPWNAVEGFFIDFKAHVWADAIDYCEYALDEKRFLTDDILKSIVDIILNAQEADMCPIPILLDKCQRILTLMYTTHPPCQVKLVRTCYLNFLTSAMSTAPNKASNISQFECEKGIVKYCFKRLEAELLPTSNDGPIISKYMPEELKESIRGLYWQKEKFDTYETLTREERIRRLLTVLESVIELIKIDLAIWVTSTKHAKKSLLVYILWPEPEKFGDVNETCTLIISLFVDFVRLGFADHDVKLMCEWINAMAQVFYICENKAYDDYPHVRSGSKLANHIHKMIFTYPTEIIIKILEKIKPNFLRHFLGIEVLNYIFDRRIGNILNVTVEFLNIQKWNNFKKDTKISEPKKEIKLPKEEKSFDTFLTKLIKECTEMDSNDKIYPKKVTDEVTNNISDPTQSQIIKLIFITLQAFINSYSIDKYEEILTKFNEATDKNEQFDPSILGYNKSFSSSGDLVKQYRDIIVGANAIRNCLTKLKETDAYEKVKIFTKIRILRI